MQTVRSTAAPGLCLKARLLLLLRLLVYPSCHTAAVVGRSRFWLFLSYMVSFASVVGAVWVLMQHYGEQWLCISLVFTLGSGQLSEPWLGSG
jgi:hypothetical protein